MVPRSTSHRPNRERIIDIEGGVVPTARDLKHAREVAQTVLDEATRTRLDNELADLARDQDTSLTIAARDRDRATPRDVTEEPSSRLQQQLPFREDYRSGLTPNQRKIRSAAKNRVLKATPAAQIKAIKEVIADEDPTKWRTLNAQLHAADGDVQKLPDADREAVQRIDRVIQRYERNNDRYHRLYFSVKMPRSAGMIITPRDLPSTLRPGKRFTLDQFTLAKHDLGELPGTGTYDQEYVIFETVTPRGLYLGRSDTVPDSTHLLPRGMNFEIVDAGTAPFHTPDGGQDRLIVQLRERQSVTVIDPWRGDPSTSTAQQEGEER